MSEAHDPRPWFRPKVFGLGWTPISWQGWAATPVFVLVVAATQVILPERPHALAAFPWLAGLRHDLGVPQAGLGVEVTIAALLVEIAVFLAVAWWTSRPTRPLD